MFKELWRDAKLAADFEQKPVWFIFLFHLYYTIRERRCKHDWIVDSHACPDYGYETGHCCKCGAYFHVRMY